MARWSPFPLIGGAYSDDTKPWSAQDCLNYIPVPAEREGTRSSGKLVGVPGMTTITASMQEAPVRGLHDVEGALLAVTGNKLYRIGNDGTATEIGIVPGVGMVSMAHNQVQYGHEVMIANGQSGYVYNTYTGDFGQVSDDGFPGFKVADFIDGYIAGIEPQGRFWAHSNLRDAKDYNTLDRYDAESAPDKMVSLIVSHREVMILNQRSASFFRNMGSATGTFQNSSGTELEVGGASTFAVARMDNTVYWLGNDGIVYRLAGHAPQRVSTGPIEQAIARCDISKAFSFTFEDRGHKVFYLTFPDGQTWGFDVWTSEWHRRASENLNRWRINALVKWRGKWIAGDFSNGRLYELDWAVQHEAGGVLERRRTTAVLHDNQNRVTVNGVELVVDTGLGDASSPLPRPILPDLSISGDLPDGERGISYEPYKYKTIGGIFPYGPISISSGSLPPGLSLGEDGTVTGTPTAGGTYAWAVKVTDADGNDATILDGADIYVSEWWMTGADTTSTRNSLWVSPDVADWSGAYRTTRSPWAEPSSGAWSGGYYQTSPSSAAMAGIDGVGEYTADLNAHDGVSTIITHHGGVGTRVRVIDNYVFAFASAAAETYSVSVDGGMNYASRTAPGGLRISDVGRLKSGRWVAFSQSGSIQRFYYSDDPGEPLNWTQATGESSATTVNGVILTIGDVAIRFGSVGRVFRTVGGASWTATGTGIVSGSGSCGAANAGAAIFGDTNSSVLWVTTDSGVSWQSIPFRNTRRIDCHNGRWVAGCPDVGGGGGIFYSDDRVTWSSATLPDGVTSDFYGTIYVAPIRYLP